MFKLIKMAKPCLNYMSYKIRGKVINFKEDERGLSDVVSTVLLVLAGVLAVGIIAGFLTGFIEDLWKQIEKALSNTTNAMNSPGSGQDPGGE